MSDIGKSESARRPEWRHPNPIGELETRLLAVEARQRAYGGHDPDCPQFRAPDTAHPATPREACRCWLSRPPEGGVRKEGWYE